MIKKFSGIIFFMSFLFASQCVYSMTVFNAADNGDVEFIKAYIESGRDVNAKDSNGDTALILASLAGREDVVILLIKAGSDVNAKDYDGFTPLLGALNNGHYQTAGILRRSGAVFDLYTASSAGSTIYISNYIKNGGDVNIKNESGFTPLILASAGGRVDVIRLLIRANADVNATNNIGWSSLHWAVSNGYAKVVKLLISAKADVNLKNKMGDTPIVYARNQEIMDILKKAGAK